MGGGTGREVHGGPHQGEGEPGDGGPAPSLLARRRLPGGEADGTNLSKSTICLPRLARGLLLPGGGYRPQTAPRGRTGAGGQCERGRGDRQTHLPWPRKGSLHWTDSSVENNGVSGTKYEKQLFQGDGWRATQASALKGKDPRQVGSALSEPPSAPTLPPGALGVTLAELGD